MADVYKVTTTWNGFLGAPGYSKLTFQLLDTQAGIDAAGTATRSFFAALAPYLMTGWTLQVQQAIQVYDSTQGHLVREVFQTSQPAAIAGTATNTTPYAGGAGAYINWGTTFIYNGRRVRGRTYLVPLVGVSASDGTLAPGVITAIQNAAASLIATSNADLAVWAKMMSTTPPITQIGGIVTSVTSGTVPDKTGILRSRRD